RGVLRCDLDSDTLELPLHERERLRAEPSTPAHQAKRETLLRTEVNPIRARTAARLPEQPSRFGRPVPVATPVRPVVRAHRGEDRAVRGPNLRKEVPEERTHDRDPVDAVGEHAADELRLEGRMSIGLKTYLQVLEVDSRRIQVLEAGDASELGLEVRVEPGVVDIEFALAQGCNRVRAEAEDQPVEIGEMRPPIAGIPSKREALASVPAFEEEGAASDR